MMATSMGTGPMTAATPRLLPHQLVPRDDRSSYIQRTDSLAGPGAYVIPSTFVTTPVNAKMRVIHHKRFGRDYARQQRGLQSTPDRTAEDERVEADETNAEAVVPSSQEQRNRYLERRERLRELLQAVGYPDSRSREDSPTLASLDSVSLSKCSTGALPLSPSLSCTSNYDMFVAGYRQQQQRNLTRNCLRSPTSPRFMATSDREPIGFVHMAKPRSQHAAVHPTASPPAMTQLSYKEYLATTSYTKRLLRASLRQPQPQPQPQANSRSTTSPLSSSSINFKPLKPASSPGNGRQRSF